ncbi:hypothetical protein N7454_006052 [Penicillium verhagenii]|nr:hypothetical protein N7454_006052 [Penicillium verhagenii]
MPSTGWSRKAWLYCAVILLAFSGSGSGDWSQDSGQTTPNQSSDRASETICPAENIWEAEAKVFRHPVCFETRWGLGQRSHHATPAIGTTTGGDNTVPDPATTTDGIAGAVAESAVQQDQEQDADTDSLLDSASFLSFEDWKKQNLAKVGQSAENVGGSRRAVAAGKEGRRQPGINNALDSLGDDSEIELDFGGFGAETPEASPTAWGTPIPSSHVADNSNGEAENELHTQRLKKAEVSRRKDAGTTCKERFNYASFDCAATVLKTNPECKGSSAVLVENKDNYMLNECRAQNKFLILELCDDILVDTVVLGNYEFFSSIFHTFRVSVSDRYPAKPDQWKELGIYEARNTREVQAFAVENSLIWARYLRIEFLTHYGHEFYCPVSLIRVHGTTMMEEYKHDESVGRTEAEDEDEEVIEPAEAVESPSDAQTVPPVPPGYEAVREEAEEKAKEVINDQVPEFCPNSPNEVEILLSRLFSPAAEMCKISERPPVDVIPDGSAARDQANPPRPDSTGATGEAPAVQSGSSAPPKAEEIRKSGDSMKTVTTPDASVVAAEPASQNATVESTGKSTTNPKEENSPPPPESIRPTSTQPPSSNPTTQESFFKSVHKRLQMLESNSTLSLLYIEEQSRILRDAFNKVEKRQLAKTSNFLENLNVTVLNELKEFREQYDHVWKSVAFEFEHQRLKYHQEVHSISSQLGVLADELVFQKRVTVIQSIMVLCCFAVVLFGRGSGNNYMEFPRVQRMVARSYSLRSSSPLYASPSASPGSTRPTSSYHENVAHRRNPSDSSSSQESPASPTAPYSPPTPTSHISHEMEEEDDDDEKGAPTPQSPDSMSVPLLATPQFRSHSTPPVLSSQTTGLDRDRDDERDDCALASELSEVSDEMSLTQ